MRPEHSLVKQDENYMRLELGAGVDVVQHKMLTASK